MGTARKCIHGTAPFWHKSLQIIPTKASQFQHCMLSFGLLVCHMTTNSVIFLLAPNIQQHIAKCSPLCISFVYLLSTTETLFSFTAHFTYCWAFHTLSAVQFLFPFSLHHFLFQLTSIFSRRDMFYQL